MELATLFLWSFLAATVLPLGSEPALAVIVARGEAAGLAVAIATLGNYLGACTTYAIGRGVRSAVNPDSKAGRRAAKAEGIVQRYGSSALLLSWVPLLGDAIVAAAGAARMKFLPFSVWTVVGKAARYAVIAYFAVQST